MSLLANSNAIETGGYQISRSVRLRSSASAYFNRTPASTTNQQTFTLSFWTKRGILGADPTMFCFGNGGGSGLTFEVAWGGSGTSALMIRTLNIGIAAIWELDTTPVFRDPSAWYHFVVAVDTTQATSTNRVKVYANGVQITSFSTANYPTQNYNTGANTNTQHRIGVRADGIQYLDGYLTEINFIDGQALTPSSFGETDTITGVWVAKKYTGSYGTNGFYLNFSDNSAATSTTIGKDYSGNGNNWTPNNISVTAGTTYDSMLDVPSGNGYADGGNGRGNYCVLNPLKKPSSATITDGNLNVTWTTTGGEQPASFAQSSGKWYWELTQNAGFSAPGIILESAVPSNNSITQGYHYYGGNGQFYTATTGVAYGATFTTGDVIGVALDLDNLQITFYKNNTSQGTKTIAAGLYNPDFASAGTITINANFGQRPFSYTPPTGFKALNTTNLSDPTVKNGGSYFNSVLYTGNGTGQTISTVGFQPDLVWVKNRNVAGNNHNLQDSVRGFSVALSSSTTNADSAASQAVSGVTSTGFTLGNNSNGYSVNENTYTYVAWNWKANGTGVSNTAGTITSTVSANTTAGFSVVTYTHNGTNAATVGHGLGVTPSFIINKQRSAASNWRCYHVSLTAGYNIQLNLTQAQGTAADIFPNAPTSSVFTPGNGDSASGQTFVAYCFAAIPGYSAFGSYTGNGSTDGPFVYCGFRPRWVLIKCFGTTSNWTVFDTLRDGYNPDNQSIYANLSAAESTADDKINILSNGFKVIASAQGVNESTYGFIYAAFAENPFKYSNAR